MNTQILFTRRPTDAVTADCFTVAESDIPNLPRGGLLTRNIYLSCDPYMRGRMGNAKSYASAFALNNPIPARVVAQVQQSDCENFAAGDYVWGFLNWENYTAVSNPQALRRVDPALGPLSHAVSVRGMPGLTAEVGMLELGAARPGDTVFVSAASGAVGSVAGQLAKLAGARVVGSAGSDRKVDHLLHNLGFDAAFNYRKDDTGTALDEFCPNGIDVYFDNVGGATLEAALARINPFARIPVCGQISAYDGGGYPVSNIGAVVAARATLTGFIIYDHMHKFDNFVPRMAERLRSGKVQYVEDIVSGIENTPDAFIGMMRGENLGKRLVKIASENQ